MSIRVGLIGAGHMGKVFAQPLAFTVAEEDLVAVTDTSLQTGEEVAARYGIKYVYSVYHELLRRDEIDAVVIVTPTAQHSEVIQAAAAAGKHIFSEKPLAQTLEACDESIAAVDRTNHFVEL